MKLRPGLMGLALALASGCGLAEGTLSGEQPHLEADALKRCHGSQCIPDAGSATKVLDAGSSTVVTTPVGTSSVNGSGSFTAIASTCNQVTVSWPSSSTAAWFNLYRNGRFLRRVKPQVDGLT